MHLKTSVRRVLAGLLIAAVCSGCGGTKPGAMTSAPYNGGMPAHLDAGTTPDASHDASLAAHDAGRPDAGTDAGASCAGGEIRCKGTCIGPSNKSAQGCHYLGMITAVAAVEQDVTAAYLGSGYSPASPVQKIPFASGMLQDSAIASPLPSVGQAPELTDLALGTDAVYLAMLVRPDWRVDRAPKAGGQVSTVLPHFDDVKDLQVSASQLFVSGTRAGMDGLFAYDLLGQNEQRLVTEKVGGFRVSSDHIVYASLPTSVGGPIKSVPLTGGAATIVLDGQFTDLVAVSGNSVFSENYGGIFRNAAADTTPVKWLGLDSPPDPPVPASLAGVQSIRASTQVGNQLVMVAERDSHSYAVLRGTLSDSIINPESLLTFETNTESPAFIVQHGKTLYVVFGYYSPQTWFVVAMDLP